MKYSPLVGSILPVVITLLALIDGSLHLALDAILFRGNFFGRLGPPPGAPPPGSGAPAGQRPGPPIGLPLPLNQMFVLNFVGYVVLVVLFWLAMRNISRWGWRLDVPLMVYAVVVFLAWVDFGAPNPMGLGYLSKATEVVLLLVLLAHAWLLFTRNVSKRSGPAQEAWRIGA